MASLPSSASFAPPHEQPVHWVPFARCVAPLSPVLTVACGGTLLGNSNLTRTTASDVFGSVSFVLWFPLDAIALGKHSHVEEPAMHESEVR
jgi:hypothetical protein